MKKSLEEKKENNNLESLTVFFFPRKSACWGSCASCALIPLAYVDPAQVPRPVINIYYQEKAGRGPTLQSARRSGMGVGTGGPDEVWWRRGEETRNKGSERRQTTSEVRRNWRLFVVVTRNQKPEATQKPTMYDKHCAFACVTLSHAARSGQASRAGANGQLQHWASTTNHGVRLVESWGRRITKCSN